MNFIRTSLSFELISPSHSMSTNGGVVNNDFPQSVVSIIDNVLTSDTGIVVNFILLSQ